MNVRAINCQRAAARGTGVSMTVTAYAASVGHSVWFSHDLGETWNRAFTPTGGVYNESRAWCVDVHADRPGEAMAGTDVGLYRWTSKARRWVHIPSPMDGLHILQVGQSPHDPEYDLCWHPSGNDFQVDR